MWMHWIYFSIKPQSPYFRITKVNMHSVKCITASNHPHDSEPPYMLAWEGWCAHTVLCNNPWYHTEVGRDRWFPRHTDSSDPWDTWSPPDDPTSVDRRPGYQSSGWSRSGAAWLSVTWKRKIIYMYIICSYFFYSIWDLL